MVTRTASDKKVADFVRAGEGLREAMLALENAHRRIRRLYPDARHEYRETFNRAYEAVNDMYAAISDEYSHHFVELPGTLQKILQYRAPWPTEVLDEEGVRDE